MPVEQVEKIPPDAINAVKKGKALWILPAQTHLRVVEKELTKDGGVLWGDLLFTPSTFTRAYASPIKPPTTPLIEKTIIFDIINKTPLRYFESVKNSLAVGNEIYQAIRLLRNNLIASDRLEKDLLERGSLKEFDLLTVYKTYENALQEMGFVDEGGQLTEIISYLSQQSHKKTILNDMEMFIVDGFDVVPRGLTKLVEAVVKCNSNLRIILHPSVASEQPPACKIELHAARSAGNECRYIAEEIINMISKGHLPKNMGIVLTPDSDIFKTLIFSLKDAGLIQATDFSGLEGCINAIKKEIYSSDSSDEIAKNLEEKFVKKLQAEFKEDFSLPQIAANLRQLEGILETIFQIKYLNHISPDSNTLKNILASELDKNPIRLTDNDKFPFHLLIWGDNVYPPLDTIFIPSMHQGSVPPEGKSSIFFQEQDFLPASAPEYFSDLFPQQEAIRAREAGRLKRYIACAGTRAILSYSRINMGGKETYPSFITALFNLTCSDEGNRPCPENITDDLRREIQRKVQNELDGRARKDAGSSIIGSAEVKADIEKRFNKAIFSASQLERYGRCPYQYFLERVIALEPIEPPLPEINPKHRGTIMHRILELFYTNEMEELLKFIRGEIEFDPLEKKIAGYTGESLKEHSELLVKTHPALIQYFKKRAHLICVNCVIKEIELINTMKYPLLPAYTEWSFGRDGVPYLTLDGAPLEHPANISGVIDRIDIDDEHNTFSITDYKSGGTQSVLGKIDSGEHLQLPLYIVAANKLLLPGKKPVGAFLFSLKSMEKKHGLALKEMKSFYFSGTNPRLFIEEERWHKLIDTALETAALYIGKIRHSVFVEDTSNCHHLCDFRDICRYGK